MNFDELKRELATFLPKIGDEEINKLHLLMDIVLKRNKAFNLTAIKEESVFIEKMILDSAYAGRSYDFNEKRVLDVGSGAGFPGLVLAILYPRGKFELLEANGKKCRHLTETAKELGLKNVKVINNRAEVFIKDHREFYDTVIARAVSSLQVLIELCVPFVKVNGHFIAMKSQKADEEYDVSYLAMKRLDITLLENDKLQLPESGDDRSNMIFIKHKESNKKYPRDYKLIITKPL